MSGCVGIMREEVPEEVKGKARFAEGLKDVGRETILALG